MSSSARPSPLRRGLTLLELILAIGLFSILVTALLQMIDTSLTIWEKTEVRRDVVQVGSSVAELLVSDVAAVHGGARGDLLAEWVPFDVDGDGVHGGKGQRIRLVRPASAVERRRLAGARTGDYEGEGLLEVIWTLLPPAGLAASDPGRAGGVLWRGERLLEAGGVSFFDEAFLDAKGRPPGDSVEEVTGGILWCAARFATQTTLLDDDWSLGTRLEDATASWDAWTRGRPDAAAHAWNERAAGIPDASELPALPRRVRVELEVERPRDVARRPTLAEVVEREGGSIRVRNAHRLPAPGSFLLVGEEWLQLVGVSGSSVRVKRAQRGTRAAFHPAGDVVHFGTAVARDARVVHYREDWNL